MLEAAGRDFEHFLRPVANLPPGSASIAIRFSYIPTTTNGDMQSRLSIHLLAKSSGFGESLRLLLERGPLNRFYNLQKIDKFENSLAEFKSCCEIVRREDSVEPLHIPEFNYKIPDYYYTIRSFEANDRNNYLDLDRVLSDIEEAVVIDICVEPVDIASELYEHTRYLSQLQSINRIWDQEEDEGPGLQDYLSDDSTGWYSNLNQSLKPLRLSDPLADDILRSQQRFHETLRQPHLLFHIKVFANTPAVAQLVGSVVAETAFEAGSYRLLHGTKGLNSFNEAIQHVNNIRVFAPPSHKSSFQGKDNKLYQGLARLSHLATVDELTGVFRLPLASSRSPNCVRRNTDPISEIEKNFIVLGIDNDVPNSSRGLNLDQITKHVFISGTPGSGKTTSIMNLSLQLYQHGIPFLILEPVKTEYRILKTFRCHPDENARSLAEEIEIYTPGNESISAFRLNPLSLLPGISIDEHIDNILNCFKAAIPVEGSLPALLGEALEQVYEDHPDQNDPPIMADLVAAAERRLAEKGYSPDTNSDFRAALEVRLGVLIHRSVGKIFQCCHSTPFIEHLMKVPTVIEFDRLHTEQASLLTLFILTNIREHIRTIPENGKELRYVIIIEEAHNIVGRTGPAVASPDIVDPKAFAADYVVRMLAELRALGIGIVIVDQLPSAVAPEVIKNTASKLAFRQVAQDDREELGSAMLLESTEIEDIARLNTGEAFFFTEGYHRPRRIWTTNLHKQFDFKTRTLNFNILPWLHQDSWYRAAATKRTIDELAQFRKDMDRFDDKRLQLVEKLASIIAIYPKIFSTPVSKERIIKLNELKSRAKDIKHLLTDCYESFLKNSYRRYFVINQQIEANEPLVEELKDNLNNRFNSIIKPDLEKTWDIIDAFVKRCNNNNK